jgi:hypothetical protein
MGGTFARRVEFLHVFPTHTMDSEACVSGPAVSRRPIVGLTLAQGEQSQSVARMSVKEDGTGL